MANVIINDTNLTNIANAIREKNGTETKYMPSEMAEAISAISAGSFDIPESALANHSNNSYRFYGNGWTWLLTEYGDLMESPQNGGTSMFENNTTLKEIPFNLSLTNNDINQMFFNCVELTTLPAITPPELDNLYDVSRVFYNCRLLREIPSNFFGISEDSYNPATESIKARDFLFANCYSLRELPDLTYMINLATTNTLYNHLAYSCYALNKISNLPVSQAELNKNVFDSIVSYCYRLKEFTFEAGKTAQWTNQTIVLTGIGYAANPTQNLFSYNAGLDINKEIYNYNTYYELKDDPDAWTSDYRYSRYNKNSAIATINSLPDTSAYVEANGGTNTIAFSGTLGASVGGAINTLTEEEIAVATAKGWTVSFM